MLQKGTLSDSIPSVAGFVVSGFEVGMEQMMMCIQILVGLDLPYPHILQFSFTIRAAPSAERQLLHYAEEIQLWLTDTKGNSGKSLGLVRLYPHPTVREHEWFAPSDMANRDWSTTSKLDQKREVPMQMAETKVNKMKKRSGGEGDLLYLMD